MNCILLTDIMVDCLFSDSVSFVSYYSKLPVLHNSDSCNTPGLEMLPVILENAILSTGVF